MKEYTVADLLSSAKLAGLQLESGARGVQRHIQNVNTLENLDSYDWLRAGDFLLTTGFIYKNDPEQLVYMVERLAQINCAGLGFKTQRYFDALPGAMLRRAEELDFPIVIIPLKYSLSDVSNEISDHLRATDDSWLSQYLSIHNSFNESVLTGNGVKGIVDTLHEFIHIPVVLVDSRWRVLSMCDPEAELLDLDLRAAGFPKDFIDSVPQTGTGRMKILTRSFPDESGSLVVRIAQLEDASSGYGYLLAFETSRKLDWMDFVAFESATIPLVLERIKAKQITEVRHQLRQDFFDDLLQGRIDSINAASSLAEIHNMDIRKNYMCMVIRISEQRDDIQDGELLRNHFLKVKNEIIYLIDREAVKHGLSIVSIHRSNLIISFIQVPDTMVKLHGWEILDDFPVQISEYIHDDLDVNFTIGIGTPISDYLNLRASYNQANEAIRYARADNQRRVNYYEDFMVDQLLDSVTDREQLENFAAMSLGVLRDHDKVHETDFVRTLEVYFECNGNVSMAAKMLFLHRNSLIYRMDRIKEILKTDLKNPTELLTLQVGLRVLKILESK